jgi:hypothetical protein
MWAGLDISRKRAVIKTLMSAEAVAELRESQQHAAQAAAARAAAGQLHAAAGPAR